jgi:hypothetical protein
MLKHNSVVHEGIRPFVCTECDKGFGTRPELIKHQCRWRPDNDTTFATVDAACK